MRAHSPARLLLVPVLGATMALGALAFAATPSGAAGPEFPQCPAVGLDTGCGLLITISSNGTITAAGDASQQPYDGTDDTLVGVQNNDSGFVSSIALSGSGIFGFDGDGICTYAFTGDGYCSSLPAGSSGYEGPQNTFSVVDASDGSVNFTNGGLAPGKSTYFSLEGTPSANSVSVFPGTVVVCQANQPCSGTATVPNSMSVEVSGQSSTNGAIFVQIGTGSANCNDSYFHAPEITTVTEEGYSSTTGKTVVLTIDKAQVAKNPNQGLAHFKVCYSSPNTFTDLYGHTGNTGLLPNCSAVKNVPPCITSSTKGSGGNVIETFVTPPGDPAFY